MKTNKRYIIILLILILSTISSCTQTTNETEINIPKDVEKFALNNEIDTILELKEIDEYIFIMYMQGEYYSMEQLKDFDGELRSIGTYLWEVNTSEPITLKEASFDGYTFALVVLNDEMMGKVKTVEIEYYPFRKTLDYKNRPKEILVFIDEEPDFSSPLSVEIYDSKHNMLLGVSTPLKSE